MHELQAKKILDAIAKKFGADSVTISYSNDSEHAILNLVKNNRTFDLYVQKLDCDSYSQIFVLQDANKKFTYRKFLEHLENHSIIHQ